MDKEVFEKQLRTFLKKVGITSQEEITEAVSRARASGNLAKMAELRAEVTVHLPDLDEAVTIQDRIKLE